VYAEDKIEIELKPQLKKDKATKSIHNISQTNRSKYDQLKDFHNSQKENTYFSGYNL
jgi:ribosomal protein S8